MNQLKTLSFYLKNVQRFWIFFSLLIVYLLGSLATSIFFIINRSQRELLEFSLADSFILIGEPYIHGFIVTFPYVITLCFLFFQNFNSHHVLSFKKRQTLWYQQSFIIVISSLLWTLLIGFLVFILSFPFVTTSMNWDSMNSFFFFKTGTLLDISFVIVATLTLFTIWISLLFIGSIFLLIYWYTDSFMLCFFFSLLFLGLMQLYSFFSYHSFIDQTRFAYKQILAFIFCLVMFYGFAHLKIITRKDFHE